MLGIKKETKKNDFDDLLGDIGGINTKNKKKNNDFFSDLQFWLYFFHICLKNIFANKNWFKPFDKKGLIKEFFWISLCWINLWILNSNLL